MYRKTTLLLLLSLIPAGAAQANRSTEGSTIKRNYEQDYRFVYEQTDQRAGCNLLRSCRDRHPSLTAIARSDRVLSDEIRVFLSEQTAQPASDASSAPTASYNLASATTSSTSGGGLPSCTWAPESGGSYTASNPSGAYGKYQIMPQTASDFGCNLATPAGQDACAQVIWQRQGPSAWVHC